MPFRTGVRLTVENLSAATGGSTRWPTSWTRRLRTGATCTPKWRRSSPLATGPRVDIQSLGWRSGGRYLPLRDDIGSTGLFYLDSPTARRPATPTADAPEIC